MLIDYLRQHKEAGKLFKQHLLKTMDVTEANNFLQSRDSVLYGEILDFMHSYGASIVLTNEACYITVTADKASRFSTITHDSMRYMYFRRFKSSPTFKAKFNHAIIAFFKLLDESIL